MEESEIESLVREVLARLKALPDKKESSPSPLPATLSVVSPDVETAVSRAQSAQAAFQEMGLEARKAVIAALRRSALENAETLARAAQKETGLGRWQDKTRKNVLVAEKTPGVEDLQPVSAYTGDQGLTLVEYAPFGVVASVTPSTNPTATVVHNAIAILSAGNSVVFAPHPSAKECCRRTMQILSDAAVAAGAPDGLITTFDPATQGATISLLKNRDVRLALVTGGSAIVRAALALGIPRKTICAGPGNPPVIVDETADFKAAAKGIVEGASFDNNVLCTGEKEVIVTEAAAESFLKELRQEGSAHELTRPQMDELARKVFSLGGPEQKPVLNRALVGKDASLIAHEIGLSLPDSVRLLWGEVPSDHPFIWIEQLMPVLPVTRAPDVAAAIELARKAEGGNHHTAAIYSLHVGHITQAARRLACSIFVKNGPTYMGLGLGEGFASMSIGTPTGDGLTKPGHFSRPLHCSLVGYLRIA